MHGNKNFNITCLCSIFILLLMCCFGIQTPIKITHAAGDCDDKFSIKYDGETYCCPKRRSDIILYNSNYYCFDKTSDADDFILGKCTRSVSITNYEGSQAYLGGDSYKTSLCQKYLDNNWYYVSPAKCGVGFTTCACIADADTCTTLATKPKKTLTITYDPNGGKVTNSTKTCVTDGTIKNECNILSNDWPIATKSGYEFNGWSFSEKCSSGSGYVTSISLDENKTVWACWKKREYKVSFDANGGIIESGNKDLICYPNSGTSCVVSSTEFPKVSYNKWTFNGWSSSEKCSNGSGTSDNITLYSKENYRYACWKRTSNLKFVYADNTNKVIKSYSCIKYNGDNSGCNEKVPSNPAPLDSIKTNFIGWSQKSDCSLPSLQNTVSVYTNDVTYYACFTKNTSSNPTPEQPNEPSVPEIKEDTFTVTFDKNATDATLVGKEADSCSTSTGSCKIDNLPSVTREGYEFTGWGTEKTCTSGNEDELTLTGNITYYACFTKNTSSEITPEQPSEPSVPDENNSDSNLENSDESVDKDGNVTENSQTGESILIAFIWFFGILAFCYACYYFKSIKTDV